MSMWEGTLWTWLRSVLIACMALPIIGRLDLGLNGIRSSRRGWVWGVLLLPLLTPGFLAGYAYGRGVLALREWEWWNEIAYVLLSLGRWVPLGLLIVRLAPASSISPMGMHCLQMAWPGVRSFTERLRDWGTWVRFGEGKKYVLTFGVLFLATFHDFDLAALMGVESWSVWLFDAQGAGLGLGESLRRLIGPLLMQLMTLVPILWLAGRGWRVAGASESRKDRSGGGAFLTVWGLAAAAGGCLVPWGLVAYEGGAGLASIGRQGNQWVGLLQEGINGLVAGGTSGMFAILISRWICGRGNSKEGWTGRWLVLVPGLFGPLAVALVALAIFQISWIARYTPAGLSWLAALIVWLIPTGVLLQLGLRSRGVPMAMHLGEMLKGSSNIDQRRGGWGIWWKLRGDEWIWSVVPLVWWSYFDLTISSMLAPAGAVSAPVRLFNQMHYGHSAMLSALTGGAVLIPVGLLCLLMGMRRIALRGGIR